MLARSAALRSSIRATRASISQKSMGARKYATEPHPTTKEGSITKSGGNTAKIIAGVFGVSIAGTYAFLMANPRKAQEVGGNYHPQAIAKEEKFNQQRGR
ncbi:hypothetical protein PG993_006873 [Apiospora rasikravindrae]|uniref:Uncharacterized protein n=1 Tax=Apiospora rasikravindrae TaxID=990691 RepID=A0ABR1SVV5_9PEZI